MSEEVTNFEQLLETSIETTLKQIESNTSDPLQNLVSEMIQNPFSNSISQFHIYDLIQHEIEDIFFRLSGHKINSFVPIIDLISEEFLLIIQNTYANRLRPIDSTLRNKSILITKNDLTLLINRIFRFFDKTYKEALLAPYHPYYAVLERRDDLEDNLRRMSESIQSKDFGRCGICWMKIRHSDDFVKCPYCGDIFHTNHYNDWISSKGTCPKCNK